MAVLVEAISIIIRKDAIGRVYPGGYERFALEVPNATLCADEALARVGFLRAAEAAEFASRLQAHGLVYLKAGEAIDFNLVDQVGGPLAACRWLSFGGLRYGEAGHIAACWFCENPWVHWGVVTPDERSELATPIGWTYERSLSWALDVGKARRTGVGGVRSTAAVMLAMHRSTPAGPSHNRLH